MRYIFILLLLVANIVNADEPDRRFHQRCLYPTVSLARTDHKIGTGVIIKSFKNKNKLYNNYVLTCRHVVLAENMHEYTVKFPTYKNWSTFKGFVNYKAHVLDIHDKYDLAVLWFESKRQLPIAELSFNAKIFIGSDITKVSCGFAEQPRVDVGKITALNSEVTNPIGRYRISAPTIHGDSGSPLFHDYKVIGIVSSVRAYPIDKSINTPVFHIGYAVPLNKLPSDYFDKLK